MNKESPQDESPGDERLKRAVRHAKRARSLGPTARCSRCGATSIPALQKRRGVVLCYECAAIQQRKSTVEDHHLLGKANADGTIGSPGMVHREVSDRRYDWPARVRTNSSRDPLVWAVSLCFSVRDFCAVCAEWLDCVGLWLLGLTDALAALCGATWWILLGVGTPWEQGTGDGEAFA